MRRVGGKQGSPPILSLGILAAIEGCGVVDEKVGGEEEEYHNEWEDSEWGKTGWLLAAYRCRLLRNGLFSDTSEGGSEEGSGLRIKLASQAVATPIQVQAMRYDGM